MVNLTLSFLLAALLPLLVLAQDGSLDGPTSSANAAGYSCDPSKCQLPKCNCASVKPPGGLNPADVPQFIVFTADDAIQSYTLDAVNQFLAQRKNPNGCKPSMTYFTSLSYTNYTLVTDWYVAGNEIADHTMTHVGTPPAEEINGNIIALNALAGIPLKAIKGFRAPYLNFTADTLKYLHQAQFTYDSSASASIPVTEQYTDAFWPYTLDYGLANNCLSIPGVCKGQPQLPGFWEIPMYAFFDQRGARGPHLMDPWLDNANGATAVNNTVTLEYMKATFIAHYNGNRQPIGIYTHPIHLSKKYPGVQVSQSTIDMINAFLDWAQEQHNVWIVSSEQLLAWTQNPTRAADLHDFSPLKCSAPQVDAKICNGMPQNEAGLLSHCAFSDFPFYTCYGCPAKIPTTSNPNPEQSVPAGKQPRFRLPANCSTPFWDPIAAECLCTSDSCTFGDDSRPIGPNGASLIGGGTGGNFSGETSQPSKTYLPFNGAASKFPPSDWWQTMLLGSVGIALGVVEARLV